MNHPIDVIIPVYRGLQDVIDCLDSVKSSQNTCAFELIVIDDCSPEPEVSQLLQERAAAGDFTLLVNHENLGFVATVNRGMQLHPERDVLLLNSDTLVANDWLDRIARAAYADEKVATVTPFSNNATICSYPTFCQDNTLPSNTPLAVLDRLFSKANSGMAVEVPTGVGFCMYIRRACLVEIGYFDVETFGKGYGEENDFCQRAIKAGWKNRFALDTFVQHTGNVSFGDEHNELKHGALGKLVKHHPLYERDVHQHIAEDPARNARVKTWLASLIAGTQPIVVHVSHNRGGGTLRFVEELNKAIEQQAYSLLLMPSLEKPGHLALTTVSASMDGSAPQESEYTLYFDVHTQQHTLFDVLKQLPIAGFHFHHMVDVPTWVMDLPKRLARPWLVSLHDYYYLCESISLTGAQDRFVGDKAVTPNNDWSRAFSSLIDGATCCITPSNACHEFYSQGFPNANLLTVYHEHGRHLEHAKFPVKDIVCSTGRPLKVIIIGALSKIKGADLVEDVATLCATHNINVEFELLGYAYRDLREKPRSTLSVYGRYNESELAGLLAQRKAAGEADLVWFTALWPETYSYTLSSAIEAGLPVVVPNIGAFPERVYQRPNSWVMPWDSSAMSFASLFKQLLNEGGRGLDLAKMHSNTPPAKQPVDYREGYTALLGMNDTDVENLLTVRPIDSDQLQHWLTTTMPCINKDLSFSANARMHLLKVLYHLKTAPILRKLAQFVPTGLQRRIKQRLSR
ncbi:glycosyltransferase [Marinomonas gallaica]|uniref:glycosyltransferase n=1 Tax=Marinomonas gallaica TaxID=1806667 RepID=UPI003A93957E